MVLRSLIGWGGLQVFCRRGVVSFSSCILGKVVLRTRFLILSHMLKQYVLIINICFLIFSVSDFNHRYPGKV